MATSPLKLNPIMLHKTGKDQAKVVRSFSVDHDGNSETPSLSMNFYGTELKSTAATAKLDLLKIVDKAIEKEITIAEEQNSDYYGSRKLQDKQDFSDFMYAVIPPADSFMALDAKGQAKLSTFSTDASGTKYMVIFDDDAGFLANGASMEIDVHNAELQISTLGRNYVDSTYWGDGKDSAAAVTEGLLMKQSKSEEDEGFINNKKYNEEEKEKFLDAYTKVMATAYYTKPPTGITTTLSLEAWNLNHNSEIAKGFFTFAGNYVKTLRYHRGTNVKSDEFTKYQAKLDAFTTILSKHFDLRTRNEILGAAKNYPDSQDPEDRKLKYANPMEEYIELYKDKITEIQKSESTQKDKVAELDGILRPYYKQYGLDDDVGFSSLLHRSVTAPAVAPAASSGTAHGATGHAGSAPAVTATALETKLKGIRDASGSNRITKTVIEAMLKNLKAIDRIVQGTKLNKANLILKEIMNNSPSEAFKRINNVEQDIKRLIM